MRVRMFLPLLGAILLTGVAFAQEPGQPEPEPEPSPERVRKVTKTFTVGPSGPVFHWSYVGGNPRSAPITGATNADKMPSQTYQEFYNWWESAQCRNDRRRLKVGLPAWLHGAYDKHVLTAFDKVVAEAKAVGYPKADGEVRERLSKELFTRQLQPNEQFLAMTFGRSGQVRKNVKFTARGTYYAMCMRAAVAFDTRSSKNEVVEVRGRWGMIVALYCRNAALEKPIIEVVTLLIPPPEVKEKIKEKIEMEAEAEAEAEATSKAKATAQGGKAVVNNIIQAPQPQVMYLVPSQLPQRQHWEAQAGSLSWVPLMQQKQKQGQQQQQLQQQHQDQATGPVNVDLTNTTVVDVQNNIAVSSALSG